MVSHRVCVFICDGVPSRRGSLSVGEVDDGVNALFLAKARVQRDVRSSRDQINFILADYTITATGVLVLFAHHPLARRLFFDDSYEQVRCACVRDRLWT